MSRWPIPKDWLWVSAADIAAIIGGGTPSTKNPTNFAENGIPWITPADLSNYQDEYISRGMRDLSEKGYNSCGAQLMPKDTVLFTSRAPVGYCALAANEICTNQGFKSLVLRGDINPKYIRHYLLYSKEYAESLASGSTFKELSGKRMATLEFPIPPFNEQKRIVAKIQELQARSRHAREALETIPDLLEQLRQSILAAAFRGDLTKEWREKNKGKIEPATELVKRIRIERRKRWEDAELEKLKAKGLTGDKLEDQFAKRLKKYKEPVPVDNSVLPELPDGWCWTNLNELKGYSIYGPRFSNERYSALGTFVLRTSDIDDSGRVNIESAPRIVLTQNELKKYLIKVGDLLITRTGSIGTLAVFNDKVEAIPGAYLLHYRLVLNRGLSWFIFHQLKSPRCQEAMTGGSTGTGRPNLNAPNLESIPLALPPQEEQEIILKTLGSEIESIESTMDKAAGLIEKCNIFDQSALSKAFHGQLVPQDPKDEPASVLLERIREEKEQEAANQKPRDKRRGRKMTKRKDKQKEVLVILREASRAMTPEEVFAAGGFEEDSVDAFYEQLRKAIVSKQVREMREGDLIQLEAIGK